jgi:farnesyl diphosphate synthase
MARVGIDLEAVESQLVKSAESLYEMLDKLLPEKEGVLEDRLIEAMRYSTLSRGKRIRPFLTIEASKLFGVSMSSAQRVAAAIEFIHAFSLIHDDLPALDNDELRRGEPSCHKKFDEATAVLAGDALLAYAFEVLADSQTHQDSGVRVELVRNIAQVTGFRGMIGGQMIDMLAPHNTMGFPEIVRLQRMKTGEFFAVSCEAGAILGKAPHSLRNALRTYARNIGIAFQITDDLLDVEGNRDITGKNVQKDKAQNKATLVECLGIEEAREHAVRLARQAVEYLAPFDSRADVLRDLAEFVIIRQY